VGDKRDQRLLRIVEMLEEGGKVETATLSHELGVTELTIRRDIDHLDTQGIARRVYGGAVLAAGRSFEPPFSLRVRTNVAEKQAMARAVVDLIPRKANVAMDFGTKAYHVAMEMRGRHLQALVAPTSVQVMEVLGQEEDIHLLVPGGELKAGELSLHGSATEQFFRAHRWDVAVVSVAGISAESDSVTDFDETDARLKATMIGSADHVIVLCEGRHLGQVSFAPVATLDGVTTVVTDAVGPNDTADALEQRGIQVIRALETHRVD
jgi:DeoR/GlpR family transcriptional regulator of sugar metabolism